MADKARPTASTCQASPRPAPACACVLWASCQAPCVRAFFLCAGLGLRIFPVSSHLLSLPAPPARRAFLSLQSGFEGSLPHGAAARARKSRPRGPPTRSRSRRDDLASRPITACASSPLQPDPGSGSLTQRTCTFRPRCVWWRWRESGHIQRPVAANGGPPPVFGQRRPTTLPWPLRLRLWALVTLPRHEARQAQIRARKRLMCSSRATP